MMQKSDIIIIRINDMPYPTYLDEHGTQRFFENEVIRHLVDIKTISLNDLARDHAHGKFSTLEYMHFNMMLGYSICGLMEFHTIFGEGAEGENWEVENPLWK